nr:hypothetical protein [Tanacetum cinerariifolium]
LDDAEGTTYLPNAAIFEELARMSAKTTSWNEFSNTMASAIIYLANNQIFNFSKYIFESMMKNLKARVKFYMFPRFVQVFVNHQLGDMSHHKGIFVNPSLTRRVFSLEQIITNQAAKIKKLEKRVKNLEGKKKKRTHGLKRVYKGRIAEIEVDEDLSFINKTAQDQGRMNNEDLFGVNDLDGGEVIVDVTASENVEQDAIVVEKEVSDAADEVVTTTLSVKAMEKDEANKDVIEEWDDVQATIDADKQLAEQLQAQEREKLSIEERSKLLANLIESRRKYFAATRAEEIRNKPPTKAQQKSLMCII